LSKRSTFAQEKRELRQQKQQCHFIPSVIKKRSKDCGWLLRVKGVSSEEMNWIRNVEKLGTAMTCDCARENLGGSKFNLSYYNRHDNIFA
jgi:hypothetical protein